MSYDLLYHQKRAIKQNFKEPVPGVHDGLKEKIIIWMWRIFYVFPEIFYTKKHIAMEKKNRM
jgi:hypothetical protein